MGVVEMLNNKRYRNPKTGIGYEDYARVNRSDAIKIGQHVYWPDTPCTEGHVCFRYTSSGHCVVCKRNREKDRAYKKLNGTENYRQKHEALADEIALRKLQDWE